MKGWALPIIAMAAVGCSTAPSKVSHLDKDSEQIKVGMPFTQVQDLIGKPDQSFNDPTSGGEVWFYKDPDGHKMLTVTFSMDEVSKVHLSSL
jgi:outer membrane protein assembly factor BamE (lipoprotein component of BamABCDE complex)